MMCKMAFLCRSSINTTWSNKFGFKSFYQSFYSGLQVLSRTIMGLALFILQLSGPLKKSLATPAWGGQEYCNSLKDQNGT